MANTPSAKKRIRQNEKRRLRNRAVRSAVRGSVKGAREALTGKTASPSIFEVMSILGKPEALARLKAAAAAVEARR